MGLRIGIDDFGTGYSSLSSLRQFPVDALKVDRSFLLGMRSQDESTAIVGTVTSMAHQLGLHVVAEGIEVEEHVPLLLRSLHCESGQGYFFARPLDVDAATDILRTGVVPRPHRIDAAITTARSQPSASLRTVTRRFTRRRRGIAIASAAAVVLTMAGVANWITRGSPRPAWRLGTARVEGRPTSRNEALMSEPSRRTEPTKGENAVDEASSDPPPPADVSQAVPQPPQVNEGSKSWRVQHLHRLGSCVGRLAVSRKGLMFTPAERSSPHGFQLAHDAFLSTTAGRTFMVKSNAGTYRFRLLQTARPSDIDTAPRELSDAIRRYR